MKKQLLFAALAAALLAGCSKTEPGVPDAPATHISAKAAGAESPETKAPLEGTSLDGKQAQVFTTTSPLEAFTGDKMQMFTAAYARGVMTFRDNSYVQYDATGFNGKEILPGDKSEVYLYGFYPTGWTTASTGVYESLSHTFDGKTDLMATWLTAADEQKIAYQGGASGTTVDKADFLFRHILTRYNVQVKCSDADAQTIWGSIQSIKLKNANIDNVSTGENFGYTYSAGGGSVSFYKLGGTTATPTYSDELFEKTTFTDMLALTTTYQNACYTMAAPVSVDADAATAELTLVVETLDKDGGKKKTAEIPLSFDRTKLTAAVLPNNTSGYSITVALNFRAGMIEATSVVEAWKNGSEQTEPVVPTLPPSAIYLTDNKADSPFDISLKSMESTSTMIWGPTASIPGIQDVYNGKANTDAIMAAGTPTDYPAANYCRDLGAEWNLPAQAQLMLMWIYLDAIPAADRPLSSGYFWSSTEYSVFTTCAWEMYFTSGITNYDEKDKDSYSTHYVRCVRDGVSPAFGLWKYPKVENGNTIVSRDAAGGIKSDGLLTDTEKNWLNTTNTSTTTYNEKSEYNKVSAKFEVASADASTSSTWTDAFAKCKDYSQNGAAAGSWRLPTQRELMLMWMFKAKLTACGDITTTSSYFRSSTEYSVTTSFAVLFWSGGTSANSKDDSNNFVRCVRDL